MTSAADTTIRFRPDGSIDPSPLPGSDEWTLACSLEAQRFVAFWLSGRIPDKTHAAIVEQLEAMPSIDAVRGCVTELLREEEAPKPADIARWRVNYLATARSGARDCPRCNGTSWVEATITRVGPDGRATEYPAAARCTAPGCRGGKLL